MSSRTLSLRAAASARLVFTILATCSLFVGLGSAGVQAQCGSGATTTTLSSSSVITTPNSLDGNQHTASPYGDGIPFSGLSGTICKVTVQLNDVTSDGTTFFSIQGTEAILVSPDGTAFEVMGGVGQGSETLTGLWMLFDDSASHPKLPNPGTTGTTISPTSNTASNPSIYNSSSYEITNGEPGGTFPYPNSNSTAQTPHFPQTDGTSTLAIFNNNNTPNGTWKLYVVDDYGDPVTIKGWTLNITMQPATKTPTTTTLSLGSTPNPLFTASPNNTATYTAMVTGSSPTGTVAFFANASQISCTGGNQNVSSGQATCQTGFAQGNYTISASYSGDSNNFPSSTSSGSDITQVVTVHTANPSSNKFCNNGPITISGALTPLVYPSFINVTGYTSGQTVSNVAVELDNMYDTSGAGLQSQFLLVSPDGTHNLDFLDGAWTGITVNSPGITTTTDDTAGVYPTGAPASGTYNPYDGSSSETTFPSSSAPTVVTAIPQVPGTINYAPPHGSVSNTLEARFNGATANGDWALYAIGNSEMQVNGGWCITLSPNNGAVTTTTVTSNNNAANNPNLGQSVKLTATVTSTSTVNRGTVTFLDNGLVPAGTVGGNNVAPVSNGQATFTTSSLTEGDHTFTASYSDSSAVFNSSQTSFVQRIDRSSTVSAGSGGSLNYCNAGAVTGTTKALPFTPNPSNIFVSGLPGTVNKMSLTLKNFEANENSSYEMDSLLVGPNGKGLDFFSNTGAILATTTTGDYTFSDAGSGLLGTGNLTPGTYQPTTRTETNGTTIPDSFTSSASGTGTSPFVPFYAVPATGSIFYGDPVGGLGQSNYPPGSFNGASDGVFDGINPNGAWSLFFNNWNGGNFAEAQNGWCLNFVENSVNVSVTPGYSGSGSSGHFVPSETNAALTAVITNSGTGSTGDPTGTNPLTVTDALDSHLTYVNTGSWGTGWTCSATGQTVTCTNDNSIAEGNAYPTLTITVNVSSSAPSSINNTFNVTGGAGVSATSGSDMIPVDIPPVLAVSLSHSGTFTQGSTGEWDITVSNAASGSTTRGTITIVDVLPTGYTLHGSTFGIWNCTGTTTATCTASPTLTFNQSSELQMLVNVPANSATSVTNLGASASGGGASNTPSSTSDTVTVLQTPASMTISGGNNQSANDTAAFLLPLAVTVKDAAGVVISGASVTFTPPVSGPSLTFQGGVNTATTNASGVATSATMIANSQVGGPYTVTASAGSASASFSLTNTVGPVTGVTKVNGDGQSTFDTTAFANPLEVHVTDAGGNPVPGQVVSFGAPPSGPSLAFVGNVVTATTDASGNATSAGMIANNQLGSYNVTAALGTPSVQFQLTNIIGPYSQLLVTAPAAVFQGKQFLFTVQEADAGGNAIAPFTGSAQFSSTDGSAVIQQVIPGGVVSNTYYIATLNTTGPQTITVTDTGTSFSGTSASITVNTTPSLIVTLATDDADTASASNCTVQPAPGNGSCTLRDALLEAGTLGAANITFDSTAFASAQTISPSATLTIPTGAGITGPTTGSGASLTNLVTIAGSSTAQYPLFTVASSTLGASIANLIVRDNTNNLGGTGGIDNAGHLTVDHTQFEGLESTQTTGTANGGAINNAGTLTVSNSFFSSNKALPPTGNTGNGGAIYTSGNGVLTVTNSTFTTNQARSSGGAIYDAANATLVITNSTFYSNTALNSSGGGGGAIYNIGTANLTVADSTFTGNSAPSTPGGAIYNQVGSGQNIGIENSIVSGNMQGTTPDDVYDLSGYVTTIPGNVIGVLNGTSTGSPAINLAPLANYGGTIQTMLPLPGSPAICAGSTQFLPQGVTTDERGFPNQNTSYPGHTSGPACVDAGAVQTNYTMTFSGQPSPISPASTIYQNANFQAAVTLNESGNPGPSGDSIALTLNGSGTLTGGSATTSAGVANFNTLKINTAGSSDSLTANLTLNGTLAITATSSSFTVAGSAPSAVSVTPSSGVGMSQQFSFVASSPNGAANLANVEMRINTSLSQVNSCWLTYQVAANQLVLETDDGTRWVAAGHPGAVGTLSNSQCSVDLKTTTVVASGNTLTVSPVITFKSGFSSGVQIYMYASDVAALNSGWQHVGWWMVAPPPEAPPSAVSVTPASGNGTTQQFSFVGSSPNGVANLYSVDMLFNTSQSRVNGCYLNYAVANNQLRLLSDDGTTWSTGQHPGTAGTLSNSQCSVDMSTTTAVASGNTLTVSPAVTFNSGFKAGVQTYMNVTDVPGFSTGWKRMGWWMVGNTAEAPPSAVSVTPSSGFGNTQQFSFVASSPNGSANLAAVEMQFIKSQWTVNSCALIYQVSGNILYMLSDDGTAWTPGHPGAKGTLSNSQCSVDLSTTTVVPSGNNLTVSPAITFTPAFNTGLNIYLYAVDIPGFNTGWKKVSPNL